MTNDTKTTIAAGGGRADADVPGCRPGTADAEGGVAPATVHQSTIPTDPITAAVLALARHGIPADVQDLLVRGSLSAGIRPGALQAALMAAMHSAWDKANG